MSVLNDLRDSYHLALCEATLGRRKDGSVNFADKKSRASKAIAEQLLTTLGHSVGTVTLKGTAIGTAFAEHTKDFLENAFHRLRHIAPGEWSFSTRQDRNGIAAYQQYRHLLKLRSVKDPDVRAALGGDYIVTPDIHIGHRPVDDAAINRDEILVDAAESIAKYSPLRAENAGGSPLILHASISCKWTMRSDRAQNTRTEALNLLRHRKGRAPHIMAVTAEPLPSRLASIASGTGDVDCAYHAFLPELIVAVSGTSLEKQRAILSELVAGGRLRDISDLPLDLAT